MRAGWRETLGYYTVWDEDPRQGGRLCKAPSALKTREEHAATRMSELLTSVEDRPLALAHFLETLPPADRDQLRRMLKGDK